MNKLLITTIVVFVIISCIFLSASVISDNTTQTSEHRNAQIQEETAQPVQNIMADAEELSAMRQNINKTNTDYQNLYARIENIERAVNTLSESINSNSRNNYRTTRENSQELKCTMTGYTDAEGKPLSEAEIKSSGRLNDEIKAGIKKISLLCSY